MYFTEVPSSFWRYFHTSLASLMQRLQTPLSWQLVAFMRMSAKCGQGSGDEVHLAVRSRCCSKHFTYVCVHKRRAHVLLAESVTNRAINWPVNISIRFWTAFRFFLFYFFFADSFIIFLLNAYYIFHSFSSSYIVYWFSSFPFPLPILLPKFIVHSFRFLLTKHDILDLPGSFHSTSDARSLF